MKGDLIDAARQNKARHMADKKQKNLGTHVVRACFSKKPQKNASLSPKGQLKKKHESVGCFGARLRFLAYFFRVFELLMLMPRNAQKTRQKILVKNSHMGGGKEAVSLFCAVAIPWAISLAHRFETTRERAAAFYQSPAKWRFFTRDLFFTRSRRFTRGRKACRLRASSAARLGLGGWRGRGGGERPGFVSCALSYQRSC
jgi:hypothetical protein